MIDEFMLESWRAANDATRERLAFELTTSLPAGFDLKRIQRSALGDQDHSVAVFSYRGSEFALVPGGDITLGYDPAKPFLPSTAQLRSFRASVNHVNRSRTANGLPPFDLSLEDYIRSVSSPLRTVYLVPFLMEVRAREAGLEPLPLDTPEVVQWAERRRSDGDGPGQADDGRLRVRFGLDGPIAAWQVNRMNGEEVLRAVQTEGFRLPTADEFEHACCAGSRTLFRWGDDNPADEEPNPLVETPRFVVHRMPSAFGVEIAQNPYAFEFVMEPEVMCGGDGGCAVCAGLGSFAAWLTLSSSFRCASWGTHPMPNAHYRRVLVLDQIIGGPAG